MSVGKRVDAHESAKCNDETTNKKQVKMQEVSGRSDAGKEWWRKEWMERAQNENLELSTKIAWCSAR